MIHLNIFFNQQVLRNTITGQDNFFEAVGNWALLPFRFLLNGKIVEIHRDSVNSNIWHAYHTKNYRRVYLIGPNQKNFWNVMQAIFLLAPGIILGTFFKGLAYCSASVREKHRLAVRHYTPLDKVIGEPNQRLTIDEICNKIKEESRNNHLNQKIRFLTIFCQPNTQFTNDLGIMKSFKKPQKIIFVGGKFSNNNQAWPGILHSKWETQSENTPRKYPSQDGMEADNKTFILKPILQFSFKNENKKFEKRCITQWKVNSIARALSDVPPRRSLFSFKRYTRIYYVES